MRPEVLLPPWSFLPSSHPVSSKMARPQVFVTFAALCAVFVTKGFQPVHGNLGRKVSLDDVTAVSLPNSRGASNGCLPLEAAIREVALAVSRVSSSPPLSLYGSVLITALSLALCLSVATEVAVQRVSLIG